MERSSYALVASNEAAVARNIYLDFDVGVHGGRPARARVDGAGPLRAARRRPRRASSPASRRDGTLARLTERYFTHARQVARPDAGILQERIRTLLPQYRALFHDAQEGSGIEWRLLAAVAYQESQWDPQATSETGVRGLMQLTEETARHLGVADRLDPRAATLAAARYLADLKAKLPERIQEPDRTWLALAAFNIGLGHLEDARVLAQKQGLNPDLWADVKKALPLLAQPEYYEQARLGYARGGMPVAFVDKVRAYYDVLLAREDAARPRLHRAPPPCGSNVATARALAADPAKAAAGSDGRRVAAPAPSSRKMRAMVSIALNVLAAVMLAVPSLVAAAPARRRCSSRSSPRPSWPTQIRAGRTTVIVPIGGTEQNGPHMTLGKHNVRVKALSEKIARAARQRGGGPGDRLRPGGRRQPADRAHALRRARSRCRRTSTARCSSPPRAASGCTASATSSFSATHGDYQPRQTPRSPRRLNREWAGAPVRVHAHRGVLPRSPRLSSPRALRARGYRDAEIGPHAGLADTSLMLAVDPRVVRGDRTAAGAGQRRCRRHRRPAPRDGRTGQPRRRRHRQATPWRPFAPRPSAH